MTESLTAVLERQRTRGLLGPGETEAHRAHGHGFAAMVDACPDRALDLGSGGGVPGLVLAVDSWPNAELVLLDGSLRRCTYLELAVADLDVGDRVVVHWGRAEEAGHVDHLRGSQDAVVARSFGPPAVTAECAAPFLAPGGCLVVSEPPEGPAGRWDAGVLDLLGLAVEDSAQVDGAWFTRLRQGPACPLPYPRRAGLPARRPLF
ncbi:MAG: RsmG family class I SAM-dependent methyltransferase [Iamia sp.]